MNTSDLIYDWNQNYPPELKPAAPVLLNDETLRDGLQSPSVRENKNQLLDDVYGRVTAAIAVDRTRAGHPMDAAVVRGLIDRGIFSAIYATPHRTFTDAQLVELYRTYFANAPFVRVLDRLPATKDTAHTNFLDLAVRFVRGKIIVLAAEDNLVRGASGVAVQNFNRMYGWDETTGLL